MCDYDSAVFHMEQELHSRIYNNIFILLVLSVGMVGIFLWFVRDDGEEMQISFLDVGQGDSIVISHKRLQVLIDGGSEGKVLRERLGQVTSYGDRVVEVILPTHPDADHIGGFSGLLDVYDATYVLETNKESSTGVYRSWMASRDGEETRRIYVRRGTRVRFPNGAVLETLLPYDGRNVGRMESNASSIVSRLTFSEHSFLFTGDLTEVEEKKIDVRDVDVLKVAHHGSKSSTSQDFLDRVRPLDAVISVGGKNRYGHPDESVLDRLDRSGARILRTDELGTITYLCDKERCEIQTDNHPRP